MKTVLVTGANGQLGKCFQEKAENFPRLKFIWKTSAELDITDKKNLQHFFEKNSIDYCLNCAAYTNVEKVESEEETAFLVNAEAVKNLAEICKKEDTTLIHFSTDYVFDGASSKSYIETDRTNPINIYGASKLEGEQHIQNTLTRYFIFRTSWLYSAYGHNFYKTILKKSDKKDCELFITGEQKGTPTNAHDLAEAVLKIIETEKIAFGLYHFTNNGEASWYTFAKEILKISNRLDQVNLHESNYYKTIAKRPTNSVLNTAKIKKKLGIEIFDWQESLLALYKRKNATL